MRKTLITLAAVLILPACQASPPPPPKVTPTVPAASNFWPTYLRILKGQEPDQACHPTTAEKLLLPCDKPK